MTAPHIMDIERHFKDCLANLSHPLDDNIVFDSPNWQRFDCPTSEKHNKNASYRAHSDLNPVPVLKFECHKCAIKENIAYNTNAKSQLTDEELKEIQLQVSKRKTEQENLRAVALKAMLAQWEKANPCIKHEYFERKLLTITEQEGLRLDPFGNILCPVRLITGELITTQTIPAQGKKKFYTDLSRKNGFHVFGTITPNSIIYFSEGVATALAIHEATQKAVICIYGKCFDTIAPLIAQAYPNCQLIYCCDLPSQGEKCTSADNANKAIALVGGNICLPDFASFPASLRPDIKRSDYNDLLILLIAHEKSRADAINILQAQLTIKPRLHNEILRELIKIITPIDFRELADIPENQNLKNSHYQIIAIEQILDLAKLNHWGICKNYDFVYVYNSEYWSLIDTDELRTFLGDASEAMGVNKFNARYFNFRDQLYKQFVALANLPKPEQEKDTILINLKNGTFEVTPTGVKLNPFRREDFMTYQLPFEYTPKATAPMFEAYLNKVLPEQELQYILAEYLGYVFIHSTTLKLEKTLLLYGTGANGKSVFYEIVRSLFGEQNTSEYSLQNLTNDNGYYRAMIANKLINYASEINGKLEASVFKQLVSGEPVEARLPYGKPFTISQYAKLIFNCNELPKDVEQTEAYFRRFLIIPFEVTIPEEQQDKQLANKIITNELSGVFNWVLKGLNRLLMNSNFTDSETVKRIRARYESESDSVKLFIDDKGYQSSPSEYIATNKMYPEYRTFCQDNGFYPVNKLNFEKRLERLKIIIGRQNIGKVAYMSISYKNFGWNQTLSG